MSLPDSKVKSTTLCTHCGDKCDKSVIEFNTLPFCCEGCKTVFQLFNDNGLCDYYTLNSTPGITPNKVSEHKYAYLEEANIIDKLAEYRDEDYLKITLFVPAVHCSSCIWLLENLQVLTKSVKQSTVNFHKKEVSILIDLKEGSLRSVAELLDGIGYEPMFNLNDLSKKKKAQNYKQWYKIGVAGFCFGNIMLLSLPEYFDGSLAHSSGYSIFFRIMNIILSLPVIFYSSSDYFKSAWASVKTKNINIDVPIALGIIVLFGRSIAEIIFSWGPGWLDSLCGLIFFMSIGRAFQQKTYAGLAFDRDYKSYFPISAALKENGLERYIPVNEIKRGNRIVIRNKEIIPADSVLISDNAVIDAGFVTGEAKAIEKVSGDRIYAGCRNMGKAIELDVVSEVSQSYLTQLWNNKAFEKENSKVIGITDRLSRYFTPAILLIALMAFVYWIPQDTALAVNALTAVLIVACPCALALSAPFTFGNALRILGSEKFYLKAPQTVESMSKINHIVFDKTGTLTVGGEAEVSYTGSPLSANEKIILSSVLRNSSHPLSRNLFRYLDENQFLPCDLFEEIEGKGLMAECRGNLILLGSAGFCGVTDSANRDALSTRVYVKMNNELKGCFRFKNKYRDGLEELANRLSTDGYHFSVISGDNESERKRLEHIFPVGTELIFNAAPETKLEYIRTLKEKGKKVLMIGDGLNDAGALKESDAGICMSESVGSFTPAGDAIMDAKIFHKTDSFLRYTKSAMWVIKICFGISFAYNIVGLALAVSGNLSPLIAAILMPLSSITVVSTATLLTNLLASRIKKD